MLQHIPPDYKIWICGVSYNYTWQCNLCKYSSVLANLRPITQGPQVRCVSMGEKKANTYKNVQENQ